MGVEQQPHSQWVCSSSGSGSNSASGTFRPFSRPGWAGQDVVRDQADDGLAGAADGDVLDGCGAIDQAGELGLGPLMLTRLGVAALIFCAAG